MNYVCHLDECGVLASLKGVRQESYYYCYYIYWHLISTMSTLRYGFMGIESKYCLYRLLKWVLLQNPTVKLFYFVKELNTHNAGQTLCFV